MPVVCHFSAAKNVVVDGFIQWTSLILTLFFGFGTFALIDYFSYKDVMPEDLRRIDGTISEVVIEGLRGRKNHTSVLLIEYPQYCFFMPFIDETLEEESPITLYVSVSDYQRVVEGRALTNREQHTIDQYSPYVMAYESGKSHVTLSDYNEWSRRDSKWGLYVGIVCILFGLGVEIWFFWRKKKNSQSL